MVNVTMEDLYVEIKMLSKENEVLSKKLDHLTSLLENTDVKKSENADKNSVIAELSQMKFSSESEGKDILESYGFESRANGDWFVNRTLHLSCRLEYVCYSTYKVAFSYSN